MLSILSGLMGFATAGLPTILQFFQQKSDQKHELTMAKLQNERELAMAQAGFASQEKIAAIEYESAIVDAQIREVESLHAHDTAIVSKASQRIINFNAIVRPAIAFIFVGELVIINFVSLAWAIWTGVDFPTASDIVFSSEEMAITFTIIGFYYGDSKFGKK
jgi:hypothetical protein